MVHVQRGPNVQQEVKRTMYSDNTILFTGNRRHKNLLENCKTQGIPVINEIKPKVI